MNAWGDVIASLLHLNRGVPMRERYAHFHEHHEGINYDARSIIKFSPPILLPNHLQRHRS